MIGIESEGRVRGALNYSYFNDRYPTPQAKRRMAIALLMPHTPIQPPLTTKDKVSAAHHSIYAIRPPLALLWGEEPSKHRKLAKYYAELGHTASAKRGETVMVFRGIDPHLIAAKRIKAPVTRFTVDIARLRDVDHTGNVDHGFARLSPAATAKRGLAGVRIMNLKSSLLTNTVQRLTFDTFGAVTVADTSAESIAVHAASVSLEEDESLYRQARRIYTEDGVVFGNAASYRLLRQTVSLMGAGYKSAVDNAVDLGAMSPELPLPALGFLSEVEPVSKDMKHMGNILNIDALLAQNSDIISQHSA